MKKEHGLRICKQVLLHTFSPHILKVKWLQSRDMLYFCLLNVEQLAPSTHNVPVNLMFLFTETFLFPDTSVFYSTIPWRNIFKRSPKFITCHTISASFPSAWMEKLISCNVIIESLVVDCIGYSSRIRDTILSIVTLSANWSIDTGKERFYVDISCIWVNQVNLGETGSCAWKRHLWPFYSLETC